MNSKKTSILFFVLFTLLATLINLHSTLTVKALATYTQCINASGASNVTSVKNACKEVTNSSSGDSVGALWLTTGGKNSDTIVLSSNATTTIKMFGQIAFNYGGTDKNDKYYAMHISLEDPNGTNIEWLNKSLSVDNNSIYLSGGFTNPEAKDDWKDYCNGKTCSRGVVLYRGYKEEYTTSGSNYITLNVNTQAIRDYYANNSSKFSCDSNTNICTMEINVYRCYLRINSSVGTQAGGCGEDPSTLKFQNLIPASTEKEYSYSSTTTIGNVSNSTLSGTNTYKISPSNSSATVSFKHTVVSNTTGGDAYYSKIHGMKYTIEVDGSEKKSTDGTQTSSQPTFNDSITVTVNPGETKQVCAYFNFEPTKLTVTTSGKTTTFSEDGKGGSNACVTIHRPAVADLSITAKISGGGKTASATADKNNPSSSETASGKIVLDGVLAVESKHTATHSGSDNAFSSKNISWAYSLNDIANYNNINKTKNLPSEQSSTIDPTSNPKPKSYSSDQIPLGTESYTISANTSVGGSTVVDGTLDGSELKATAQIEVENPWNFDLKPTVSSDTTSSSYAGSGATARFMVNSERKDESIRATIPPDGTILQYAQIILDGNIESQNAENLDLEGGDTINDISTFNICQFFKNRLSTAVKSECGEESRESRKYYADEENGWNINETFSDTFLNSAEVGDKICYAVAVNYVDSGYDNEYGIDYKYVVPATANQRTLSRWRNHWRISNLSCGTTSKRPHFEVWGGSVYSAGKVAGATMRYYENGSYKIFGSWVDFGIVAKKAISKVASGASLAQGSTPINNSSPEPSFCDYSPLTITNHECIESNTKLGNSSINMESITLNRLRQKFTPQPNNISSTPTANLNADSGYTGYETKKFTNQATNGKYRYTYSANDLTINPDGPSILPQGITHIIYAKGNITINRNLTYSDTPYAKASDIPQYIIISDKNISISENVTRIDAWLVADKGIIDTCNKAEVGDKNNGVSLGVCSESLEVNGPVFAKKIKLDRTAGADPSSLDTVDDYAEKFDVGAATYLWAYNQALNYDQAKTVHLRELAPRY